MDDQLKWNEIAQLSESSLLPKLPSSFYYEEDDSHDFKSNLKCIINTKTESGQKLLGILTLLKSINNSTDTKKNTTFLSGISQEKRQQLTTLIALIGEQYSSDKEDNKKPWSTVSNSKVVLNIISEISRIFNLKCNSESTNDLSELFLEDFNTGVQLTKTIFGQLLKQFRLKLVGNNDNWKYFPAAKASFCWILFQVKYPYLSDFIPGTLQPVLHFYDDFQVENQLDGLDCIDHIVDNVNKADLCAAGSGSWCAVIYKSLYKLLQVTSSNGQVVCKLIPELLKILKLLEKDPPHENSAKFTLYDEVLETMLNTIEFGISSSGEDYNKTKIIWLEQLNLCLEVMGFATLHWITRILRIFNDNTSSNDIKRWLVILKGMKICIANTWLRPESQAFSEIILRILYNLSMFEVIQECGIEEQTTTKEQVLQQCVQCFDLLKCNSDYENVKRQLLELTDDNNENKLLQPKFLDFWEKLNPNLS